MTPGVSYVELTLEEICARTEINLSVINPTRVSTLGFPGSIDEKITAIGNSLCSFTRLKKLDLSRNAITTLDGLSSLKTLEALYLYYNLISNSNELTRLTANGNLKVLDLRLNPVTKCDYRSMVISMLPKLHLLDERVVSLPERKLAESMVVEPNGDTAKVEITEPLQNGISQSGSFTEILKCLNEIQSPLSTVSIRSFSPISRQTDSDEILPSERLQLPDTLSSSAKTNVENICDKAMKNICSAMKNPSAIDPMTTVKAEFEKLISSISTLNSSATTCAETLPSEKPMTIKKPVVIDWGCQTDFSVTNSVFISTTEYKKNLESQAKLEQLEKQVVHSKRYEKLTTMLQESHDVLVRTNAQLVKELEEMRQRHYLEVAELTEQYRLATAPHLHNRSLATEETGYSDAESEL